MTKCCLINEEGNRDLAKRGKSKNKGMWMPQQKKVWEVLSFPLGEGVGKIGVFGKDDRKSISKSKS